MSCSNCAKKLGSTSYVVRGISPNSNDSNSSTNFSPSTNSIGGTPSRRRRAQGAGASGTESQGLASEFPINLSEERLDLLSRRDRASTRSRLTINFGTILCWSIRLRSRFGDNFVSISRLLLLARRRVCRLVSIGLFVKRCILGGLLLFLNDYDSWMYRRPMNQGEDSSISKLNKLSCPWEFGFDLGSPMSQSATADDCFERPLRLSSPGKLIAIPLCQRDCSKNYRRENDHSQQARSQ